MNATSTEQSGSDDWWARPGGRSAPRQSVDRELAVETALAMIGRDGFGAFSMRKLASELGVGAPSLYWHVVSREQLLGMVLERAMDGFELPDQDAPWQDLLVEMAHRWWQHWAAQPDVSALLDQELPPFPAVMRNGDWIARLLIEEAGLSRRDAAYALAAFQVYLLGAGRGVREARQRAIRPEHRPYVEKMLQLEPDAYPHLRSLAVEFANVSDPRVLYDLGLRSLVQGFAVVALGSSRPAKRSAGQRTGQTG